MMTMPFDSGIPDVRADTRCMAFPDERADTGCMAFPDVRADTGVCPYGWMWRTLARDSPPLEGRGRFSFGRGYGWVSPKMMGTSAFSRFSCN